MGDEFDSELSPKLIRHILLSSILWFKNEFTKDYGPLVFCIDAKNPWRKQLFPYYKYKRGESKKNAAVDWDLIYQVVDLLKAELRDYLRFKVVEVKGAEADDIIAVLAKKMAKEGEKVLILSSDEDFLQLQKFPNVSQYSLNKRQMVETDNPKRDLLEHIIRGCSGDGIPNIFSPLNSYKKGVRCKPVMQKKLDVWLTAKSLKSIPEWDDDIRKRFKQNHKLIDFEQIPEKVKSRILQTYEDMIAEQRPPTMKESTKFSNYFLDNGLTSLFNRISEFV